MGIPPIQVSNIEKAAIATIFASVLLLGYIAYLVIGGL
jgi:hypothetical protein